MIRAHSRALRSTLTLALALALAPALALALARALAILRYFVMNRASSTTKDHLILTLPPDTHPLIPF